MQIIIPENFPLQRVFLIGMPGSGKSFVGKYIAKKLNRPFFDLDVMIENKMENDISTIFEKNGETAFRILESQLLQQAIFTENAVVATGGGTPCFNENIDFMLQSGIVIYINTDNNIILQRLKSCKNKRPLFNKQNHSTFADYLNNLLNERIKFYQKAHWTWNVENNTFLNKLQL